MLNIRLQRVGRKNDPSFRVIVADSKLKPKTGNVLEVLGSYNARMGKPVINTERVKHWMSVGAQTSGTIHNILVDLKVASGKKVNVLGKKTPIVKEVPKDEAKAPVAVVTPATEAPADESADSLPGSSVAEVVAETAPEEAKASE